MDLHQLEMLEAVVDTGSYSRAGEQLHVSHSAIHRQVKLLEYEVGDRILVRTGRNVKLTVTGEILLSLSRKLRNEVLAAERQIHDNKQLHSGRFRIGTGTSMLVFFLPQVLVQFRKEYPGIEVQVSTGTATDMLEGLKQGTFDVGVILASSESTAIDSSFVSEVLYREEYVVAVSKNHPLAKQNAVPLDKLAEYPFITYSRASYMRHIFEQICAEGGITPKICMELENEEAMEPMIAINMGIALLSRRRAISDGVPYLRISNKRIYCNVTLVFLRSDYTQRAIREFGRICRSFGPPK